MDQNKFRLVRFSFLFFLFLLWTPQGHLLEAQTSQSQSQSQPKKPAAQKAQSTTKPAGQKVQKTASAAPSPKPKRTMLPETIAINAPFKEQLEQVMAQADPNVNLGVALIKLEPQRSQNKLLFAYNENRFFTIASTTKAITAIAALKTLGPDYTFDTKVFSDPASHKNLYIRFDNDPGFKSHHLTQLVKQSYQKLGHPIDHVYIHTADAFATNVSPGWMIGDTYTCWAAPVNTYIIDNNCYNMERDIDKQMASKTNAHHPSPLSISTPSDLRKFVELKLSHILKNNQLSHKEVLFGSVPEGANLLAVHHSEPLKDILVPILKNSDNFMGDAVFQKISRRKNLYDWKPAGKSILKDLEMRYGISLKSAVYQDGSGLSRYNTMTPLQFAELLEATYYDKDVFETFFSRLPQLGIDGTLRNRHKETPLKGKFFAKTGTMTGVLNLVGYLKTDDGMYVVTIFINNYSKKKQEYKLLQDQIVELIYRRVQ